MRTYQTIIHKTRFGFPMVFTVAKREDRLPKAQFKIQTNPLHDHGVVVKEGRLVLLENLDILPNMIQVWSEGALALRAVLMSGQVLRITQNVTGFFNIWAVGSGRAVVKMPNGFNVNYSF